MSFVPGNQTLPLHLRVAASNGVARGCAILLQLISIPMLTRSLGNEQFAAYAVTVSLIGWYMLLDLGIGNAIQNFITEFRARSLSPDAHIANALLITCAAILVAASVLLLFSTYFSAMLFSRIADITNMSNVLLMSGVLMLGSVMASVCGKILYALELGVAANVITLTTSICSFAILLCSLLFLPKESWLFAATVAYSGPAAVAGLSISLWLIFKTRGVERHFDGPLLWLIMRRSSGFWLVSAIGALIFNLDYVILSQTTTATEIAEYNILQRIFGTALTFYAGLLSATWPHWSQCMTEGKRREVIASVRQYLKYGVAVIVLLTGAVIYTRDFLFELLLPESNLRATSWTIVFFGIYIASRVWTDTFATLLLATNDTKFFICYAPFHALLSVVLQLWLSQLYGLNGILLALICATALTSVWLLPLRVNRIPQRL